MYATLKGCVPETLVKNHEFIFGCIVARYFAEQTKTPILVSITSNVVNQESSHRPHILLCLVPVYCLISQFLLLLISASVSSQALFWLRRQNQISLKDKVKTVIGTKPFENFFPVEVLLLKIRREGSPTVVALECFFVRFCINFIDASVQYYIETRSLVTFQVMWNRLVLAITLTGIH